MAGEVTLICTMHKDNLPVLNTPQVAYLLVQAQPTGVVDNIRMPLNLTLVLDRSGSMGEGHPRKIDVLKDAVKLVLDQLQPEDVVSVVIFDDKVDVLVPAQPATNPAAIKHQVDRISDRGGTTMSLGMSQGLEQARQNAVPGRVTRMLLLTDGQTYGDEETCEQLAAECLQAGVKIMARGLGDEWNDKLIINIATNSGGDWDHIEQPQAILNKFQEAYQEMASTVVQNAYLTLRLVTGVTPRAAWQLIPIKPLGVRALSDRDVQVSLGELQRDGQGVLVELMMAPRQVGRYRIAQAELAYDISVAGIMGEKARQDVVVGFTADPVQAQAINPTVMNLVEKVNAFKNVTRALDEAAVDPARATQRLRQSATVLLNLGEADLAQQAQQAADQLAQTGQASASVTKKLQAGVTRRLTQRLDENP
jgi:Ca-activated chloride channel family protein